MRPATRAGSANSSCQVKWITSYPASRSSRSRLSSAMAFSPLSYFSSPSASAIALYRGQQKSARAITVRSWPVMSTWSIGAGSPCSRKNTRAQDSSADSASPSAKSTTSTAWPTPGQRRHCAATLRSSAFDVWRSCRAESATTTPSMKVAVRAMSMTVRAAVVVGIP